MDPFDDRPISVYDNLNMSSSMHTSTPKQKHHQPLQQQQQQQLPTLPLNETTSATTPPATTSTIITNGNTTSPYAEISFKFDDNNKIGHQRQQQLQQQQQFPQTLPNGNQSFNQSQQQQLQQAASGHRPEQAFKQVHMNTPYYATPIKPTTTSTNATGTIATTITPPITSPPITATKAQSTTGIITKTPLAPLQQNSNPAQTTATSTTALTTTPSNAFSTQRPLSQHSQSELNESIAAVKAALNDAKSKFFGLNGYSQNNEENINNKLTTTTIATPIATTSIPITITTTAADITNESPRTSFNFLLPQSESDRIQAAQLQKQPLPQPPPKPQPKYQNIPENSAIFRNQQAPPPELPPKPLHLSPAHYSGSSPISHLSSASSPTSTVSPNSSISLSSPDRIINTTTPNHSNMPLATSSFSSPLSNDQMGGSSTSKLLPHATYKQLPLNDIDSSHPSQAVYMSTTVPQNIKGSKIAGRHTPTRNSLRHSRMLVVNNKNYQGSDYPNPLHFKRQNIARWLLILEILIGVLLLCLTVWIFLLAPNTMIQDNPYWSGLALVLAGSLGLGIIRYQRIKRQKFREHCFTFLRANSYVVSLLAVLLCCVALICATVHFVRLTASDTKCASTDVLLEQGSCTCTFHAVTLQDEIDDSINDKPSDNEENTYSFEYRDLSCQEVTGEWTTILGLSIALNGIGMFVGLLYIGMLVCCRYTSKRYYSSVQTSTF